VVVLAMTVSTRVRKKLGSSLGLFVGYLDRFQWFSLVPPGRW